ncbi:glycosyltransferase [Dechloromonas sp. TW-R-39-2]|uniref:glycosyltransferase n=1 Tax=Dechloromonas sp. TW-R-39-2 TaxID=2654218 RepID=UPI00193E3282|nr:glycosyltransferase [Dechloromonas sp. TW-R-39-2]QRM19918.1 glycosyltransferase [Dechloromonas sp. TW-R-39-2]
MILTMVYKNNNANKLMFVIKKEIKSTSRWVWRKFVVRNVLKIRKITLSFFRFSPKDIYLSAASTNDGPDYFLFGVINWHFRYQRPQQLSSSLSALGRRVFYISSDFYEDARPGFSCEPLDDSGKLFQIKLFLNNPKVIYHNAPDETDLKQLRAGIGQLLKWVEGRASVSLIQHPFWFDIARVIPKTTVVYDCIDYHDGFGNNSSQIIDLENRTIEHSDALVLTSEWLNDFIGRRHSNKMVIRNACDFQFFSKRPGVVYRDRFDRKIIGYFGAIASWFDVDLVRHVSEAFPDCCILLIGADTVAAGAKLFERGNVEFVGEVEYSRLTEYLYSFDVAILPFKVLPLTLATNPVKVYEYLSSGCPVVSVDLPEMRFFDDCVDVVTNVPQFIERIAEKLNRSEDEGLIVKRKAFAEAQTWESRARDLAGFVEKWGARPKVSVIVVAYNNIALTKACLDSIDSHSGWDNLELIVVDNGSTDGTVDFLGDWSANSDRRLFINNGENLGFSAANNIGLSHASGEFFVLLNNDTYVTPGWLHGLIGHLMNDDSLGLVGPVTNNIGNEAKIKIDYSSMDEMMVKSNDFTIRHLGDLLYLNNLAFFCVAFPRRVFDLVGGMDESFGLGFFEDDDYCRRVASHGLKIACAQDVFVHHHLSASFMKMDRDERRQLFADNKARFEKKWGRWDAHKTIKRG